MLWAHVPQLVPGLEFHAGMGVHILAAGCGAKRSLPVLALTLDGRVYVLAPDQYIIQVSAGAAAVTPTRSRLCSGAWGLEVALAPCYQYSWGALLDLHSMFACPFIDGASCRLALSVATLAPCSLLLRLGRAAAGCAPARLHLQHCGRRLVRLSGPGLPLPPCAPQRIRAAGRHLAGGRHVWAHSVSIEHVVTFMSFCLH